MVVSTLLNFLEANVFYKEGFLNIFQPFHLRVLGIISLSDCFVLVLLLPKLLPLPTALEIGCMVLIPVILPHCIFWFSQDRVSVAELW